VATNVEVREMRTEDLEAVLDVTNAAVRELIAESSGRKPDGATFAQVMGLYRLAPDPPGCHVVATQVPGSSWHTQEVPLERGYKAAQRFE
jgi:hypothetical protein